MIEIASFRRIDDGVVNRILMNAPSPALLRILNRRLQESFYLHQLGIVGRLHEVHLTVQPALREKRHQLDASCNWSLEQ